MFLKSSQGGLAFIQPLREVTGRRKSTFRLAWWSLVGTPKLSSKQKLLSLRNGLCDRIPEFRHSTPSAVPVGSSIVGSLVLESVSGSASVRCTETHIVVIVIVTISSATEPLRLYSPRPEQLSKTLNADTIERECRSRRISVAIRHGASCGGLEEH